MAGHVLEHSLTTPCTSSRFCSSPTWPWSGSSTRPARPREAIRHAGAARAHRRRLHFWAWCPSVLASRPWRPHWPRVARDPRWGRCSPCSSPHLRRDAAHFPGRGGARQYHLVHHGGEGGHRHGHGLHRGCRAAPGAPRQALRIHTVRAGIHAAATTTVTPASRLPNASTSTTTTWSTPHEHGHGWKGSILKSATKHTVQVTLFIFLITIALNVVHRAVGGGRARPVPRRQPGLLGVRDRAVGLIPNCAASVVITQLYVEGVLGAGAMLAGLLVSAGVGLLVLAGPTAPGSRMLPSSCAILHSVFWGLICNGLGVVF